MAFAFKPVSRSNAGDGQEAVIDRLAPRVAEDLVQGETVQHVFEEGLIASQPACAR